MKYLLSLCVFIAASTTLAQPSQCLEALKKSYGNYRDRYIRDGGVVLPAFSPLIHPRSHKQLAIYNFDCYVYSGHGDVHNSYTIEAVVVEPKTCEIVDIFFIEGD
ncbi:hypothetical protein BDW_04285 [Bdellovibrio bacteriovorus W]|nr:hypothetical protein BDW_04285 [Bdellovibrio bacteriovorus W]